MSIAFFFMWLGSVTDRRAQANEERRRFNDQFVRAQTGMGASGAVSH